MSSCLYYITNVDTGQFNSYIDVIYPDLDVNVLMMLTKWYITRITSKYMCKSNLCSMHGLRNINAHYNNISFVNFQCVFVYISALLMTIPLFTCFYDTGQFNSYIDVIYPDLDVNVLMMLTKWYITRFL
jgi:hypothetical protein